MRRLPAKSACPKNERHQNLSNQAMKLTVGFRSMNRGQESGSGLVVQHPPAKAKIFGGNAITAYRLDIA